VSQHKKDFSKLIMAIVGDIKNSRVARSQIHLYKILGVKEIRLIGPSELIPDEFHHLGVSIHHDLKSGLDNVDVINMLRIQFERTPEVQVHDIKAYHKAFGLTPDTITIAKPDAIVLHPGPLNRGVEIATEIADGPQSLILEQVRNGVIIRMAILEQLLSD
jgi:aspartate carbamoyltransferase catalytic subunit